MRFPENLYVAFRRCLWTVCLLLFVAGCAAQNGAQQERDYLPGGVAFFSMGQSQPKENFQNIEIAQFVYSRYSTQRTWIKLTPGKGPGMYNMFQSYVPLNVRWKLKDGRELILENIDIRSIMREYFKTNDIKMPWQKEVRPKADGDVYPSVVFEVKDETVVIKWLVTTNRTSLELRFTSTGAATKWDRADEEFIVTTLKGMPTQGIDFTKIWEFDCPSPKCRKE